ncbi:RNA polymerase sigma factor (sigma-70 family) [Sediminihabitans luteus]|uniref:RNA polymerase sigma factor (Sigma-70 family) n=1 Tax=Sediminihabitans luteus TaxID=1138585 RepID=A0A2M9CEM1_9CELL|nr:sigma-70 family RNA polymerase sigma factor [Sediminihabitans luteus]PJJ70396.1 RNA polymerase sigma factor (sigma-70 family) [Sediminihabitans luteus]GII97868.1 hypothetical protein Slu03_02460 [Sediminihabitans luteus]
MEQVDTGALDSTESDAELITAVRAGSTVAFGELYARHAGAALAVARQYVPRPADADDVVSDAFARVLVVLQGGGGPDVAFRAYLFTVVRRLSYDAAKGAQRSRPTDDVATFESAFGPMASTEDPTLEGFERSTVARAFESLPERWRSVLWYSEVESMTPAQIAPMLGLSANGVAALAYRAREGLRQAYLQQHLGSPPAADCELTNGLLGSYVRGGLAKRETAKVDAHLETCDECRGIVLELGDVSHGMRGVIAPLVLGVGALGLAGTALPVGGTIAAAGAAAASSAAGSGATGSGAAGSGTTATGTAGAGTAGAGTAGTGTAASGTAASGTAASGTAVTGTAATAGVGAGAAGTGAAAGGVAALTGAGALGTGAAATGLAAFVAAAPAAAVALAVGAVAVVGAGVVGVVTLVGKDEPPAVTEPAPTRTTPGGDPAVTPSAVAEVPTTAPGATAAPSTDPTSPTTIPAPVELPIADASAPDAAAPVVPAAPVAPVDGTGSTPGTGTGTGTGGGTDGGTGGTPVVVPTTAPPVLAPNVVVDTPDTVQLVARVDTPVQVGAENEGTAVAEGVTIDVVLPKGVDATSTSVGVFAVPQVLDAAALACSDPRTPSDAALAAAGARIVSCDIGDLAPGERKDAKVTVRAQSGGRYQFGATAWRKGAERPPFVWVPWVDVPNYGGELAVAVGAPSATLANPGAARFTLDVTNTGDTEVSAVTTTFDVPAGAQVTSAEGAFACEQSGTTATCVAATALAAGERAEGAFALMTTTPEDVPAGRLTLRGTTTATGARSDVTSTADVTVAAPWSGVSAGVGTLVAQCTAGTPGTATLSLDYRNDTDQPVAATLVGPHGSGRAVSLPIGGSASGETALMVTDGLRLAGGSAAVRLAATVTDPVGGGTRTVTRADDVPAGTFGALDCYDPAWDDVTATARTIEKDGSVAVEVTLTDDRPAGLEPAHGTLTVGGAKAVEVEVAAGGTARTVVDLGTRATAAGAAVLDLAQTADDAAGAGGEPGRYTTTLRPAYGALYVPDWSGQTTVTAVCSAGEVQLHGTFVNRSDRAMDTRLTSTLGGYLESLTAARVAPGESASYVIATGRASVTAGVAQVRQYQWVAETGRGYSNLLPGAYDAIDCGPWTAPQDVPAAVCTDDGFVAIVGRVENTSSAAIGVQMLADVPAGDGTTHLETEAIPLDPGATSELRLETSLRSLPAGQAVELRQWLRSDPSTSLVTGTQTIADALDCTRVDPRATIAQGADRYDADAAKPWGASVRTVTVALDNSRSNVPVTFTVTGPGVARDAGTVEVAAGATSAVTADVVTTTKASYDVRAGSWSTTVAVDGRTPACAPGWRYWSTYEAGDTASLVGWNFVAVDRTLGAWSWIAWRAYEKCSTGAAATPPMTPTDGVRSLLADTPTKETPAADTTQAPGPDGSTGDGAANDGSADDAANGGAADEPSSSATSVTGEGSSSEESSSEKSSSKESSSKAPSTQDSSSRAGDAQGPRDRATSSPATTKRGQTSSPSPTGTTGTSTESSSRWSSPAPTSTHSSRSGGGDRGTDSSRTPWWLRH